VRPHQPAPTLLERARLCGVEECLGRHRGWNGESRVLTFAAFAGGNRGVAGGYVKTTAYFENEVLRKRAYLRREWCERVASSPARREVQPDGRVRFWEYIEELDRYLRVVTPEDGERVHNAFPDRGFKENVE
jgi:hypothetical protein